MSVDFDNSGSLFRNDRKVKPTQPDYRGSLTVEGVEYWVSGWLKESKDGKTKFMSLSVDPKEAREEQPAAAAVNQTEEFPF